MGYLPGQPLKSKQLRERYRLQRRRQALAMLGCIGAGVLFGVIVLATVLLARSCERPAGEGPLITRITRPAGEGEGRAMLAGVNTFRNAPWLMAVDDERLFVAQDSQRRELTELNYPIDTIAAYSLGENTQQWELELPPDSQADGLLAIGGNACLYTTHLSDPPFVELRGLAGNDGTTAWSQRIDLAEQVKVTSAAGMIVINYRLADGYRLVGYRGTDGKRSSLGVKLPLRGLTSEEIDQTIAQGFQLYSWDDVVGYSYYNVAGIVDATSGKLLCENPLDYYVYDMAYSAAGKRGYALSGGETRDSYIVWELARNGAPLELYRFLCPSDEILLLATDDYVAVAFEIAEGVAAGSTKLVVLRREFGSPAVEHKFDGKHLAADIAYLPSVSDEPARWLLALNGGADDDGWPTGKAQLFLVDPAAEEPVALLANLKQPVQYMWTLKQDCLVVCRGGQVYSYDASKQQLATLARLKYELALPLISNDGKVLALASAPRDRWQGRPGRPLAVAAFKQANPAVQ